MKRHTEFKYLLCESLTGSLTPEEQDRLARHLSHCSECAALLRDLEAMPPLERPDGAPDLQRSPEYWDSFPSMVEARIRRRRQEPTFVDSLRDAFSVLTRPRAIGAVSGAFALLLIGFFLWQRPASVGEKPPGQSVAQAPTAHPTQPVRMDRYLQRSKTLLVGLNNLPDTKGMPIDLDAERNVSRELVREARELKQQPMDTRAARLIEDLEKIQIAVANMNARRVRPDLEVVRSGIREQNLLFKVRMAEALYRAQPSGQAQH